MRANVSVLQNKYDRHMDNRNGEDAIATCFPLIIQRERKAHWNHSELNGAEFGFVPYNMLWM